jgi:hypothetical protein
LRQNASRRGIATTDKQQFARAETAARVVLSGSRLRLRRDPGRDQESGMSQSNVSKRHKGAVATRVVAAPDRRSSKNWALLELDAKVAVVQRDFTRRVVREESPLGFFAFVLLAAPRYLGMIEHLRGDHRSLLGAIASLRARIQRADASQLEELTAEGDAVLAAIAEHEDLEREILDDALNEP